MPTENKDGKQDQADILTEVANLRAQCATHQASIETLTKERDTIKSQLEAANTNLAAVTSERDTLKTENAGLQTKMADFNKSVAAEVAKAGINSQAAAPKATESKPKTLTERCIEANKAKASEKK